MKKIDISDSELELVKDILIKHLPNYAKVYAFGSRVTHKAKPTSDLDLAIDLGRNLKISELAKLNHEFDESIFKCKVDIVDITTLKKEFFNIIQNEMIQII